MVQDEKVTDRILVGLERYGFKFNQGHLSAFVQKKIIYK